ncbi:MAG: lipid-binding SYLF domain-containing protein [Nitrospiraceae bacterium]
MQRPSRSPQCAGWIVFVSVLLMAIPMRAEDPSEQQLLVDKARITLDRFRDDPGMKDFLQEISGDSRGLFIMPEFMRGAFVIGGAGGRGVLLVRQEGAEQWRGPIFYTVASASFGLQAGADITEVVLVIKTQKGVEEFYKRNFKLGLNAGMAVGPVGSGSSVHGIKADMVSYGLKKGAFVGIAADGALMTVSDDWNAAYYGKQLGPSDIIMKQEGNNPASQDLHRAATSLMPQ